jgi:hypothetical protein
MKHSCYVRYTSSVSLTVFEVMKQKRADAAKLLGHSDITDLVLYIQQPIIDFRSQTKLTENSYYLYFT